MMSGEPPEVGQDADSKPLELVIVPVALLGTENKEYYASFVQISGKRRAVS